jgi:beta-glucosidase
MMKQHKNIFLLLITLLHHCVMPMEPATPTIDPNQCLMPTNDHAEYIIQQPGWPTLQSSFKPFTDGNRFKQTWLASAAKKKNPQQKDFLFGVSSSAYQVEGDLDHHNATAEFYRSRRLPTAGNAIDMWTRYEEDIKQMKNELGINSFRLSIAWDRIQPDENTWDEKAIGRYIAIIQTCKAYDIEPIVTLHQYTIPTWFAQRAGFEKKENNKYFVEYAKKMYVALYKYVTYWSTFNAPEAYAIKGYAKGENSPGIIDDWQKVQEVLVNMLDAHVEVYQAIKGPNGLYNQYADNSTVSHPRIGIQKNIIMLDPSTKTFGHTCLIPVSEACCTAGSMLQNKVFYDFFTQGKTWLWIPSKVNISHLNVLAPQSIDWIGINFYSNMLMAAKEPQEETDPELQTENPRYRNYPEGIARAIEQIQSNLASTLNIPIMITENGIATPLNSAGELKRKRFFQRALFTVQTLLQHGYNIIGYLPWSSHDSYEWPTLESPNAFTQRLFGFFAVDRITLTRTLKESSTYYRDFIQGYYGFVPHDKQ